MLILQKLYGVLCFPQDSLKNYELVPPSLPRSSYVSSSFWFILQCLFRYPVCVHPLYVLQPLFLVLFYFLTIFSAPVFSIIHWFFSLQFSFCKPELQGWSKNHTEWELRPHEARKPHVASSSPIVLPAYLFIFCPFSFVSFLLVSTLTMFIAGLGANFEYDLRRIERWH